MAKMKEDFPDEKVAMMVQFEPPGFGPANIQTGYLLPWKGKPSSVPKAKAASGSQLSMTSGWSMSVIHGTISNSLRTFLARDSRRRHC